MRARRGGRARHRWISVLDMGSLLVPVAAEGQREED